jgi:hypothetical protein
MGQGVLSLRMSALYAGLAAAALITAFVVAATTSFGAGAATIVLVSAALGFVVGRTPMGEGAEGAAWTRLLYRLARLVGTGVIAGGALMLALTALRDVVERAAPSACTCELALCHVPHETVERAAFGAEAGVRLAAIAWIVSLPGALGGRRRGENGRPRARRC